MSVTALITTFVEKSIFQQENFAIYEHRGANPPHVPHCLAIIYGNGIIISIYHRLNLGGGWI
jgi:hypothetical protein